MASSSSSSSSGGIGVLGLLGVVFITLKLCHVIDWSWWWVTCPFWGGMVLISAVLLIVGLVMGLVWLFKKMFSKLKPKKYTEQLADLLKRNKKIDPYNYD